MIGVSGVLGTAARGGQGGAGATLLKEAARCLR